MERDQVLIDVETNKVVLEIVSPSNGIIEDIRVSEGDEVESGQILMHMRDKLTNEQPAPPKPEPIPAATLDVIEIKTPHFPDSENGATIAAVYVQDGQTVAADQKLIDVETDKVVLEVISPSHGIIEKIQVETGSHVAVEQTLMTLRETEVQAPDSAYGDMHSANPPSDGATDPTPTNADTLQSSDAGVTIALVFLLVVLVFVIAALIGLNWETAPTSQVQAPVAAPVAEQETKWTVTGTRVKREDVPGIENAAHTTVGELMAKYPSINDVEIRGSCKTLTTELEQRELEILSITNTEVQVQTPDNFVLIYNFEQGGCL